MVRWVLIIFGWMLLSIKPFLKVDNNVIDTDRYKIHGGINFCTAAAQFGVPAELVAGVYIAEQVLNRGPLDTAQDFIFKVLLETHDDNWWRRWSVDGLNVADGLVDSRGGSNKWPVHVVATGIVWSIGPAQITPRTALRACNFFRDNPSVCSQGVRELMKALLDVSRSPEIASMVLSFERSGFLAEEGIDLADDLGRWATAYNFGGEYYRVVFRRGPAVNFFGRWVSSKAGGLRRALKCS
jgi:hypothetical protein